MNTRFARTVVGVAALIAFAAVGLSASDPLGVYCVVSKVVMSPDETQPNTIQIWGACSVATGGMQEDHTYVTAWYTDPQPGYLYYSAPAGKQDIALKEWKDLKSVAGTGAVVAFGGRYMRNGRVRWADEKPATPDVYPIQMGVVKVSGTGPCCGINYATSGYPDLFAALRKAAGVK